MRLPKLRQLRERAGLTAAQLAHRARVRLTGVSRIEVGGGERRDTARELAAALGVRPTGLTETASAPADDRP